MTIVTIPMSINRYGDGCTTEHVLNITGTKRSDRRGRYGVGFCGPEHTCRRVHGGPVLPGPYGYVFQLCTVIDNFGGTRAERERNLAAGIEHDVVMGDYVFLLWDGELYPFQITENFHGDLSLTEPTDRIAERLAELEHTDCSLCEAGIGVEHAEEA